MEKIQQDEDPDFPQFNGVAECAVGMVEPALTAWSRGEILLCNKAPSCSGEMF